MSDKLSQIAEKYIKEKHTDCKGFEYDAFKDGYAQALADERERIVKELDELKATADRHLLKGYRPDEANAFAGAIILAKEIVNGGKL